MICQGFMLIFYTILKISLAAYRQCATPIQGKLSHGSQCYNNTICKTEYCSNLRCACPTDSFLDNVSGLCAKRSGHINERDGDCGYVVSPKDLNSGSLNTWTISGEQDNYITFIILSIDMNPGNCNNNYLEVREGSTLRLNRTCTRNNNTINYVASISNTLTVTYKATSSGYTGFRSLYYVRKKNAVLTETFGYIVSPGHPVGYLNSSRYTWHISARKGKTIIFSVEGKLENKYDYVKIYDEGVFNFSSMLHNLTGDFRNTTILSYSSNMFIEFTSDSSIALSGFQATYLIKGYGQACYAPDECGIGFFCYGSVCRCGLNQFYQNFTDSCIYGALYGENCATSTCADGLTCTSHVCNCTSSQYYSQSLRTCVSRQPQGSSCSSTPQCYGNLICIDGVCSCPSNQIFSIGSMTCLNKLSHGNICNTSIYQTCAASFVCELDRNLTKRCLCPSNMYAYNGYCYEVSELKVNVLSRSLINANDMRLYWSTNSRSSSVYYDVSWSAAQGSNSGGHVVVHDEEVLIKNLTSATVYYVKFNSLLPPDNFYNTKSVSVILQLQTKRPFGYNCTETQECDGKFTCVNEHCGCHEHFFYHLDSETCQLKGNRDDNEEDMSTLNIALITIAALGWTGVIVLIVASVALFHKHRKAKDQMTSAANVNTTNGNPSDRNENSSRYTHFPKTGQASDVINTAPQEETNDYVNHNTLYFNTAFIPDNDDPYEEVSYSNDPARST